MTPKRLTVLGVGLLGGSIGLAAKSAIKSCKIIGYGHRKQTLDAAMATGIIDEGHDRPEEAVRGADLVILCTPIGLFGELLGRVGPALQPGCLVTDVGSTKRSVVELAEKVLPASVHFVGSHPMAGSEKRGVEFARVDLFQGALCLITPTQHTQPAALADVEAFWRLLGMQTRRLTADEHDRRLADVSHLPHAVAATLVSIQEEASLALSGKGFMDATRIAAGDGALWRDIFLDNRDNLIAGIGRLEDELIALKQILSRGDAEGLRRWLDAAAVRRQNARQSDQSNRLAD